MVSITKEFSEIIECRLNIFLNICLYLRKKIKQTPKFLKRYYSE